MRDKRGDCVICGRKPAMTCCGDCHTAHDRAWEEWQEWVHSSAVRGGLRVQELRRKATA